MAGYAEAKSGGQILQTVMVSGVPFSGFQDVFIVVDDVAAIMAAIQQSY